MKVWVWFGGDCASVAVPPDCTTAGELEAVVAADPSLGLAAGKFHLMRRGLGTEVDDAAVGTLAGGEHLKAVVCREKDAEGSSSSSSSLPDPSFSSSSSSSAAAAEAAGTGGSADSAREELLRGPATPSSSAALPAASGSAVSSSSSASWAVAVSVNQPLLGDWRTGEQQKTASQMFWRLLCCGFFPAALGFLLLFSRHAAMTPAVWEGDRMPYMEGSVKALCAVNVDSSGYCTVTAAQCASQSFACGDGFFNGTDAFVNETTCYVQPGCRGVHFAEPEPSADQEYFALPFVLLLLGAGFAQLLVGLLLASSLLPAWGTCRVPLRVLFACGVLMVLGLFAFTGYDLHLWSEHVDTREAWKNEGSLEECTEVTRPVSSTGQLEDGYGYADVTSARCPRPMRLYLSKSEHELEHCEVADYDQVGLDCKTEVTLTLELGRTFACYTKPSCSVEAKIAVDTISQTKRVLDIIVYVFGTVFLVWWFCVYRIVFHAPDSEH